MKPIIKFIIAVFLLNTSLFANYRSTYIPNHLKRDLGEGKVEKYQKETIPMVTLETLKQRAVLNTDANLTRHISGTPTFNAILSSNVCRVDLPEAYTSTIYELDLPSGVITCMYAAKGNLYNPMGLFKVNVPEVKAYYGVNSDAAKAENASAIAAAEAQFAPLLEKKQQIINQMNEQINAGYLTIPELLMAAVLTDDEIIDIPATKSTGKFQLKEGYTSKFTESSEVVDNTEYLLADAATIFEVYTGLSGVSMDFLLILTVGFGLYGAANFFGKKGAFKLEGKKSNETDAPYIAGLALAVLFLFPVNSADSGEQGGEYELLKNRYQGFEKFGYYNFSDWAQKGARVIIDAEIDALIRKSGLATKEQIVSTAAQKTQAEKLQAFYYSNYSTCLNDIYKKEYLLYSDNKTVFGETDGAVFPSTEHWAYFALMTKSLTEGYYGYVWAEEGEYPKFAFSSCGKAEYLSDFYSERKNALTQSFGRLIAAQGSSQNTAKMDILGNIFEFQYKLYRDWGMLSVLGLPITRLQSEQINNIGANSKVIEKLAEEGVDGGKVTHSLLSSIPYMLIPGTSQIFDLVYKNAAAIGGATGAIALGSQSEDGTISGLLSWVGGAVGGAAGSTKIGAGMIAAAFAYKAGKILLMLLPILGLTLIGLLRFIVIILKIFSFHFLSLFILPVAFLQNNVQVIAKFTAKILATMLELPIFVLAVWLATTAHSLIATTGSAFRENILNGMLDTDVTSLGEVSLAGYDLNDIMSRLTIYFFDGIMEVGIAVFAIIIIYKIVITLHAELFNTIDLSTSSAIDNSIDQMRHESSNWGSRI